MVLLCPQYPYDITKYRLAKEIGVSQARIAEIIAGKSAIIVDKGLRLSKLGLNNAFWIGLHMDYDTATQRERMAETLTKIKPLEQKAA